MAPRRSTRVSKRQRPLALAYSRVSTAEQADNGASLASQQAALSAEAERRGWDVEHVIDAGVSGKSLDGRPLLVEALDRLDVGEADVLLAVRTDRVSRSTHDFTGLIQRAQRRGWNLALLDQPGLDLSTPAGLFMATTLGAVGELERRLIGQRTREGMAQKKLEGVVMGRPKTLPVEVAERIVSERAAGASWAAIAQGLNADQVPTAQGGSAWWPATCRKVALSSTVGTAA